MQAEVKKYSSAAEFWTEERCYITEIANDSGDENVSIARARVEPGITTAWHKLKGIDERYIVIAGSGTVEIGDLEPIDVFEGDIVRIPAGTRQRITNTGITDLVFYAVCSPRFQSKFYLSLE